MPCKSYGFFISIDILFLGEFKQRWLGGPVLFSSYILDIIPGHITKKSIHKFKKAVFYPLLENKQIFNSSPKIFINWWFCDLNCQWHYMIIVSCVTMTKLMFRHICRKSNYCRDLWLERVLQVNLGLWFTNLCKPSIWIWMN